MYTFILFLHNPSAYYKRSFCTRLYLNFSAYLTFYLSPTFHTQIWSKPFYSSSILAMEIIESLGNILFKVGLFVLVQTLVYLILTQSSNVFSKTPRSFSFKPARSVSIRRMAAALADMPAGGELSPTVNNGRTLTREKSNLQGYEWIFLSEFCIRIDAKLLLVIHIFLFSFMIFGVF